LADLIADHLNYTPAGTVRRTSNREKIESFRFGGIPDGELKLRLMVDDWLGLVDKNVIIVGSSHNDEMEETIYRLGCAVVGYGARRLIVVNPFFGYSTMERATEPGDVVTAKASARMFSSIPRGDLANYFLMMDLHVSGLQHYFEGDCRRFELYAETPLIQAITDLNLKDMIVGSADLGRTKWVKTFARHFQTRMVVVDKDREGEDTEVVNVIGDVKNASVLIYDDMTRSGGTLIKAADAYFAHGAREVNAVLSHAAFNSAAVIKKLEQSRISRIVITNTHPMSQHKLVQQSEKFVVVDISSVFADALRKIIGG
jgi:ribose-phosphate pyrophosphokinase